MKKAQILEVDFSATEGLMLNWNYTDLSRQRKFYRHYILLLTESTG